MTSQTLIINQLGVKPSIDVTAEIEKRVSFLASYLRETGLENYTLGISGGIDSSTAGRLAQLAVERLRAEGRKAEFVAVRLPHGIQKDEDDAQAALVAINPDQIVVVNIEPAVEGMMNQLAGQIGFDSPAHFDFIKGNVKARQRMIAQYAIAGRCKGLVIGTDHAAEAVMGFFTKHGDGACDLTPLSGLNKRQVRAIAAALGIPAALVNKTPTADLEELVPGKPDEVAYGVTYDEIDDFLEGKQINPESAQKIMKQFIMTIHKRELPFGPAF